jgi:ribosomal protein L29
MKKNEFIEIKKMDIKALKGKAKAIKKEIADFIIDKNMNKMPNLKSIKNKRNELSKTLTVLRQKELMEELEKQTKTKEDIKDAKE